MTEVHLPIVHVRLHLQHSYTVVELSLDRVVLVGGDWKGRSANDRKARQDRAYCCQRQLRSCCGCQSPRRSSRHESRIPAVRYIPPLLHCGAREVRSACCCSTSCE